MLSAACDQGVVDFFCKAKKKKRKNKIFTMLFSNLTYGDSKTFTVPDSLPFKRTSRNQVGKMASGRTSSAVKALYSGYCFAHCATHKLQAVTEHQTVKNRPTGIKHPATRNKKNAFFILPCLAKR